MNLKPNDSNSNQIFNRECPIRIQKLAEMSKWAILDNFTDQALIHI